MNCRGSSGRASPGTSGVDTLNLSGMSPYSAQALHRRVSETIRYDVVRSLDEVEIRRYPSYILATVSGLTDNEAFGILFDYISGTNRSRKRIPMTAPVMSAVEKGEKIAMAPPG